MNDVIIVGAGPSGSTLANHLARSGYKTLILDKSHFPRTKVCGDLISAKGLATLDELGCLDEVERESYIPIEYATVYLNGKEFSRHRNPKVPGLPPHGYTLPRVKFDDILLRRAQEVGAEIIEGCRVNTFSSDGDRVEIDATVDGRPQRFSSQMVIGADGVQSIVAKVAGLRVEDGRYVNPAIRAYCHGLKVRETVLWFDENYFPGYGWIIPIDEERCNVGVGIVKEALVRSRLKLKDFYRQIEDRLKQIAREQGVRYRLDKAEGWTIKTYGGAEKNYFDRGLLIGDAGCFVDPISGEGIPMALETAGIAKSVIDDAFRTGAFGAASLANYETRWRAHADKDFKVADLIVSMARNPHLKKLSMSSIRIMGLTAARDKDYALTLGGIMGGLIPASRGLSPDILLKSWMHSPQFWMQAFGMAPHRFLLDLASNGFQLASWQAELIRNTVKDSEWSAEWAREVRQKAVDVFRLSRVGSGHQ